MILPLLLLLSSCSPSRKAALSARPAALQGETEIIQLVLQIQRDTSGQGSKVQYLGSIHTAGRLKTKSTRTRSYGNVLILECYENDRLTGTQILEHPLFKSIEYDTGDTLKRKSVVLDEEELLTRMEIGKGNTCTVKVYERLNDRPPKVLLTFKP